MPRFPRHFLPWLATSAVLLSGGCAAWREAHRPGAGTYYRSAPPNAGITLSLEPDGAYALVYMIGSDLDSQLRGSTEEGIWTVAGNRVALHPRQETRDARFDAWRTLFLGRYDGDRVLFLEDPGRTESILPAFVEWKERRRPPASRPH